MAASSTRAITTVLPPVCAAGRELMRDVSVTTR